MAKYRKRPVVIEALQYDGTNWGELEVFSTSGGSQNFFEVDPEDREGDPEITAEVWDKLHSTWVGVKTGQWIIKGVQGEFYPCDPDVFESTYEKVEDGQA